MLRIASASGNVFGYLWHDEVPESFDGPRWARTLCARGTGLGLDGLFLVHRLIPGMPWVMEHWEPDGSLTFCSNGTRAAASMLTLTQHGHIQGVVSGECVSLCVENESVGLRLPEGDRYRLQFQLLPIELPHVFGWTGTPHLVIEVPDVDCVDLRSFAAPLRLHPLLPEGANVSILHILAPGRARIRTWERGVEGETLCCGQGCAVAGAWLAVRTELSNWRFQPAGDDPVEVSIEDMQDGNWAGLWLSGPVRRLGTFEPEPSLLRGT